MFGLRFRSAPIETKTEPMLDAPSLAEPDPFLLQVFAELTKREPSARLVLVGAGPLEDQVRRQVTELRLDERVLFLGRRADVPELLSAMDRMLLPSLHEGFPLVTIEAQASGLTCLLSDAITPEVVASPFAQRLSIQEGPSLWVDAALTPSSTDRSSGAEILRGSAFTSASATMRVEAIYALTG